MRKVFLSGLWLVPMLVWACGGDGSATPNPFGYGGSGSGGVSNGEVNLPCDVEEVIKAKCQNCHGATPTYGSPMSLVTAADFAAPAKSDPKKTVAQLVKARIYDAVKPMPPPPTGPLDAQSRATLDAWLAEGAPGTKEACMTGGGGSGGGGVMLSFTPDIQLRAETPWTMPQTTTDEYVCIGVDVTVAEKRHITAIAPAIDNKTIVHHVLLYESATAYDPTPTPCGAGGPSNGRLVSVWAPGGQALEFPPEAGMPLDGTKHYMMQMHYSNLMQLDGQTDLSGFDMCTTTNLRANDADILAFGTISIDIPAHATADRTCDITVPSILPQINLFYAMPHMHKLGTVISGQVKHAAGDVYELASRNPWSFDDQYWDKIATTVGPGDTVSVRCAWNNPTAENVSYGEKTSDEMCYMFAAYWPRISLPAWNWGAGAAASQCTNTP